MKGSSRKMLNERFKIVIVMDLSKSPLVVIHYTTKDLENKLEDKILSDK